MTRNMESGFLTDVEVGDYKTYPITFSKGLAYWLGHVIHAYVRSTEYSNYTISDDGCFEDLINRVSYTEAVEGYYYIHGTSRSETVLPDDIQDAIEYLNTL
jgi:hypothetical protein